MKSEERRKKLGIGKLFWVFLAAAGNLLILVAILVSMFGVSTPHPTDSVQRYDCGSMMSPKVSLSDSKLSTDIVCKEPMGERRGSMMGMLLVGWVVSTGGLGMFLRARFRKPKTVVEKEEKKSE